MKPSHQPEYRRAYNQRYYELNREKILADQRQRYHAKKVKHSVFSNWSRQHVVTENP